MDFKRSALVLIDLQKGIVPIPANGEEIVKNAKQLIERFRKENGIICFVRVTFHDGQDALRPVTDQEPQRGKYSDDWAELVPELGVTSHDIIITKRQWGAFFGTELDLQLRRRGIDTLVLGGISTNIGVETTAREAYQLGYNQIFITDAMGAGSREEHDTTCKYIFPKIGKSRVTEQFLGEK